MICNLHSVYVAYKLKYFTVISAISKYPQYTLNIETHFAAVTNINTACFVLGFFFPDFWIISLLQDAAALAIFMYVCIHHTFTTACVYKGIASMQPHLSPSSHCLMSARLFKSEDSDKSNKEERQRDG